VHFELAIIWKKYVLEPDYLLAKYMRCIFSLYSSISLKMTSNTDLVGWP
jgi:hypothetical protein